LLTDGLANVGVTDPSEIERRARMWCERGVSTTALGVGTEFDETLLEKLARAGDGNYYHVETPVQFTDLFQTELRGLMGTVGYKVSLGVEVEPGVRLIEVLNDFEQLSTGRYKLPNLVCGMPQRIVVRLLVEPRATAGRLCTFRVAWTDPARPDRQSRLVTVDGRAPVPRSDWDCQPVPEPVAEQIALLMSARAQREAAVALRAGDPAVARDWINVARCRMSVAVSTARVVAEREAIDQLDNTLSNEQFEYTQKMAHYRAYQRQASKASDDADSKGPSA
jgi:Ca-activated chloride channel family protein